jgi:hypothetical protein
VRARAGERKWWAFGRPPATRPHRHVHREGGGVPCTPFPSRARACARYGESGPAFRPGYDREARIVALDIPDREAILHVLEECPEEMLELRATLLQEHVWRQRECL